MIALPPKRLPQGACRSVDLCVFFAVELPWAFGARMKGMRKHIPAPWWEKWHMINRPNSVEIAVRV